MCICTCIYAYMHIYYKHIYFLYTYKASLCQYEMYVKKKMSRTYLSTGSMQQGPCLGSIKLSAHAQWLFSGIAKVHSFLMQAKRVSTVPFSCPLSPDLSRHASPPFPSLPIVNVISPSAAPELTVLAGSCGQNAAAEVTQHCALHWRSKGNY